MKSVCWCNKCGKRIEIKQKEVRCEQDGMELVGKPVNVRAFMCPNCGNMYVVSVMTDDMIERGKNIESKEEFYEFEREERELRERYIKRLLNHN